MNKKFWIAIGLISILFLGCSDQSKEDLKQASNDTIDKAAEVTNKTTDKATEIVEKVKKDTKPVITEVIKTSKDAVDASKEVISQVTHKALEVKEDLKQKIHSATAPKIDAKALFTKCAGCHGVNADKKALSVSQVIRGWNKNKILEALHGYQRGTYGGAMKSIMQGQVASLNEDQLEALATYISSL